MVLIQDTVCTFLLRQKSTKKATQKRCTSRFLVGARIELCATVGNSNGCLIGS